MLRERPISEPRKTAGEEGDGVEAAPPRVPETKHEEETIMKVENEGAPRGQNCITKLTN